MDTYSFQTYLEHQLTEKLSAIEVFEEIDSTNAEALRRLQNCSVAADGPSLLVARAQSAGRGRRGRNWLSPKDRGLYFSLTYFFNSPLAGLQGLSLVTALALHSVLAEADSAAVKVKWPNDVLHDQGKLAGILLESKQLTSGAAIVFGVGLNLTFSEENRQAIDRQVANLSDIVPTSLDKQALLAAIVGRLLEYIQLYEREGFASFQSRWNAADRYIGREVIIESSSERLVGISAGVDENGELILQTSNGRVQVAGGEVLPSLRAVTETNDS